MSQVFDPKALAKMSNEELLATVVGKKVRFTHKGKSTVGTITGGVFNGSHQYYIFKAFHVEIDGTGEKASVMAIAATIL